MENMYKNIIQGCDFSVFRFFPFFPIFFKRRPSLALIRWEKCLGGGMSMAKYNNNIWPWCRVSWQPIEDKEYAGRHISTSSLLNILSQWLSRRDRGELEHFLDVIIVWCIMFHWYTHSRVWGAHLIAWEYIFTYNNFNFSDMCYHVFLYSLRRGEYWDNWALPGWTGAPRVVMWVFFHPVRLKETFLCGAWLPSPCVQPGHSCKHSCKYSNNSPSF